MGNRQSNHPTAGRGATSDSSGGATGAATSSSCDFSALSSGVCRIRLAEKRAGTGFLWRDGWVVTLASVLPTASDVERATFVFGVPSTERKDAASTDATADSNSDVRMSNVHFYPRQRLAMRKTLTPGEEQSQESFARDLVFIKLGRQEVPNASEAGTSYRFVDSKTASTSQASGGRGRRAPSRRSAPWEMTEEESLKVLPQLGMKVTSINVSDLGTAQYFGVKTCAHEKSGSSGSIRRRSLRRQSRNTPHSLQSTLTHSTNVLRAVGFLLYSWSSSESGHLSGTPVFDSTGQLVGILSSHLSGNSEVIGWSGAMAEELGNAAILNDVLSMYGYGKLQEELTKGDLSVMSGPSDDDAVLTDQPSTKALQTSLVQAAVRMEEGAMSKLANSQFAQQVRLLSFPRDSVRRLTCHRHSMYL